MADAATMMQQLANLQAAYGSGALSVQYEGKNVTYRSANELLAAISSLQRQLGINTQPARVVVRTDKGW